MLKGFRARLIVFSLLAVAPLFAIRFAEIWRERSVAIAETNGRVVLLAQQAAKRQAGLIDDTHALLDVVKGVPTLRAYASPVCDVHIRSFRDARPWIENLSITDESGTIRCSASPYGVGVAIADREYYRRAWSQHRFAVSDVLMSRVTKRPTIVTALPFLTNDGERLTFLATLKLSWLDEFVAQAASDLDGDVLIVDRAGNVVASHVHNGSGAPPADIGRMLNAMADGPEGRVHLQREGGEAFLFGYALIPETSARIFVGADYDRVTAPIRAETRAALRDLALAFAAIAAFAWVGGEILLLRPVRNLVLASRRIAEGDYGTRADEDVGPEEFRNLGRAFNVMVDRLEALADMDPMTGLANRRQLDRHLRDLWQRAPTTPVAVAMIDVDHFKRYNDLFGHVRGDKCLQAIALVVKSHGRRGDDLAARFGGEEFTLVTPGMSAREMAAHCDRLRESVEGLAMAQPDARGIVTVSVGVVSVVPIRCPDPETAIRHADAALYAAKEAGRNRVSVHAEPPKVHTVDRQMSA